MWNPHISSLVFGMSRRPVVISRSRLGLRTLAGAIYGPCRYSSWNSLPNAMECSVVARSCDCHGRPDHYPISHDAHPRVYVVPIRLAGHWRPYRSQGLWANSFGTSTFEVVTHYYPDESGRRHRFTPDTRPPLDGFGPSTLLRGSIPGEIVGDGLPSVRCTFGVPELEAM